MRAMPPLHRLFLASVILPASILIGVAGAHAQAELGVPAVEDPVRSGVVQRPAPPPPPDRTFDAMPVVVLQGLDKVTARTSTFEVKVGETASFGQLAIHVKACRKAPPIDTPESAAFLDVVENPTSEGAAPVPVFVGWMFASSPALSAMEHPVYDIWVKDCKKAVTNARSSSSPP
ncbi:DUF2155 domain-containing protein [Niveispirillum irakense]|uniref:DUF2155 domain-containing protein n=1 Tax=Niveispirillum irakense TaxID=34011 RepID=UPI001FE24232|nr:DUF2155 domain-containing protein [Niveispirillum irakense]